NSRKCALARRVDIAGRTRVPMLASKCLGKLPRAGKARIDFRQGGAACLLDPVEKRGQVLLTVVACGFEPGAALRQCHEAENTRRGDQGMRFTRDPLALLAVAGLGREAAFQPRFELTEDAMHLVLSHQGERTAKSVRV